MTTAQCSGRPEDYGPVTAAPLLPPGWRCSAYWYATHRGLPVTFSYLLELGRHAARAARWYGIAPAPVAEGIFPAVHTWEPWLWDQAAAELAGCHG